MEHILITGGTGFIGTPLVRALLALDKAVIVLTRGASKQATNDRLTYIRSLDELSADTEIGAIINLAGEPLTAGRWNRERKAEFVRSRVSTTEALYSLVERLARKPEVLLNGSAIGWYGPHDDEVLGEDAPPTPCFSHTLCEAWESSARTLGDQGLRVCLLRTGIVLGENGGPLPQLVQPLKLGVRASLAGGNQYLSWIHLDDMIALILFLLEAQQVQGVVNCTAPAPVTQKEFTAIAARHFRTWITVPVPGALLSLLVGEMAEEVVNTGQRVIPAAALEAGYCFRYPTLDAALEDLLAS